MILAAEKSGTLKAGSVIVEATSGNNRHQLGHIAACGAIAACWCCLRT